MDVDETSEMPVQGRGLTDYTTQGWMPSPPAYSEAIAQKGR